MKLPFILSGISAVYLLYLIGKEWYNETVGLLSAAFLASLQFAIMYSQLARPYTSGLFLSLLMVYFWSLLVRTPSKNFNRNLIFFMLSASLCAYNHHFSLLFAALVGVSGLFFIQKNYLIKYVLSGVGILVLYLPHLSVFLHQLSMGGIEEWLAKPQNDFFFDYMAYAFHYSYLVFAAIAGLIIYGYITRNTESFTHTPRSYYYFSVGLSFPFWLAFSTRNTSMLSSNFRCFCLLSLFYFLCCLGILNFKNQTVT